VESCFIGFALLTRRITRLMTEKEKLATEKDKIIAEKAKLMMEKDSVTAEKDRVTRRVETLVTEKEQVARRVETLLAEKEKVIIEKMLIQEVSINAFTEISEKRDPSTGNHVRRIGLYSKILAESLADNPKYKEIITPEYIHNLAIAALLHDIGKVSVADAILKKTGRLSVDEFEMMKLHTVIGGDLIAELERQLPGETYYTLGKEIAYHHHQKWNGNGYPNVLVLGDSKIFLVQDGVGKPLREEEIPLSARIVSVADVYDALTSWRVYKEAYPHEKVRGMIFDESGRHFDPDVVDAFRRAERRILKVNEEFRDNKITTAG
jgi:putative two-component system response regulator